MLSLAFLDGLDGALVGTGAAADADIGVDDELVVALGDCLNGALVSAGAALDASIGDIESHDNTSILICCVGASTSHLYSSMDFEKCNSFFMYPVYFFPPMGKMGRSQ
jgi:hypothetical protein